MTAIQTTELTRVAGTLAAAPETEVPVAIETSAAPTPEHTTAPGIGALGVAARVLVGVALLVLAVVWRDPRWRDALVGLVAMPVIVTGVLALRARRSRTPLHATGPLGHALNLAIFAPLVALPATAGAAFVFYGASMLVAAACRSGGCEVTAIPNAVLGRDDQVGCLLFAPVDIAEAGRRGRW